jgi:2-polyprenyl-6-methoxyphenol hydroxylase-like FAD-dependent oxidoreductase
MSDDESYTPVLIVGGGPVGLALAADLGRRGIEATVVERRDDQIGSPKMLEVSVRTMEFCRQLGISEEVRNWGFPLDHPIDSVFVTTIRGYELGRVKTPALGDLRHLPYSPERGVPCPQTWFDPILQRHCRSFPHIKLGYRTALDGFVQDRDGVTAYLVDADSGRREQVRASYLVGCDGFQSTVRELLGIAIRGEPHIDWTMNIYLRIADLSAHHDKGKAFRYVFVGPQGSWSFISAVNGKDLWRLQHVGSDRTTLQDTDVDALVRRCMGGDVPYKVEDKILWVRKRTVADRFSDGRVFLAGDAAHAHPPNGGLGMNTGIQDAFDLGWKLAAVLQGWGGPILLDTYDYERRPASTRATEASLKSYRRVRIDLDHPALNEATPAGEKLRRELGQQLVEANERTWHPTGVHLGYVYNPSPIVIADEGPRPIDDEFEYEPSSFPGARAPHAWLGDGQSVLDLFGHGFTLLKFTDISTDTIEQAALLRKLPLTVHRIGNTEAARLYDKPLVLVRPDGHVAWRGDHAPHDAITMIDTVRGAGPLIAARRPVL